MHYEAELVVVIGKTARKVTEADAMAYVAGYTVCNDYAIRDYLENYYRPNLRVKSRDTLTPIGPWIVSKEAIPSAQPGAVHLGQRRTAPAGHHRRSDLQHSVPDRLPQRIYDPAAGRHDRHRHAEGLSDVVPGDEVIVEVEGVGRLVNHIISQQAYEEKLS